MSMLETLTIDALRHVLLELPLDQRYHCTTVCKELLACREELRLGLTDAMLTALITKDYLELLLLGLSSDKLSQGEWVLAFCREKFPLHVIALQGEDSMIYNYLSLLAVKGCVLKRRENLVGFVHRDSEGQEQAFVLSLSPCPYASQTLKGITINPIAENTVEEEIVRYFTILPDSFTSPDAMETYGMIMQKHMDLVTQAGAAQLSLHHNYLSDAIKEVTQQIGERVPNRIVQNALEVPEEIDEGGPRGPIGDRGCVGPTGMTGSFGYTGVIGPTGMMGPIGPSLPYHNTLYAFARHSQIESLISLLLESE